MAKENRRLGEYIKRYYQSQDNSNTSFRDQLTFMKLLAEKEQQLKDGLLSPTVNNLVTLMVRGLSGYRFQQTYNSFTDLLLSKVFQKDYPYETLFCYLPLIQGKSFKCLGAGLYRGPFPLETEEEGFLDSHFRLRNGGGTGMGEESFFVEGPRNRIFLSIPVSPDASGPVTGLLLLSSDQEDWKDMMNGRGIELPIHLYDLELLMRLMKEQEKT